ncbi:hypothetical protein GC176_11130 [bacterium]|nr:hypothetical protein [bacterium]
MYRFGSGVTVGDCVWAVPRIDPDGGIVTRTILLCPRGECLIEHYDDPATQIVDFRQLQNGDFAELVYEPGNPWCTGQNEGRCLSTFNCCSFAVGELVGLTPRDWLGTTPTSDGYPTPMAVILDSYFSLIAEIPVEEVLRDGVYESDERFLDKDVVCFEILCSGKDTLRRHVIHAGQVRKDHGINRLLSKFGQGPILLSDLRFPNRMFQGASLIRIYRFHS